MLGFAFSAQAPEFEETIPPDLAPRKAPEYLARGKALSLNIPGRDSIVVGADTIVFLGDEPMGKPAGHEEALTMLTRLNGRTHHVITGVAVAMDNLIVASGAEISEVTFSSHNQDDLRKYASSPEPLDKAGAYAIQGKGAFLVERINGCFYNIMGLPVQLTLRLIKPFCTPEIRQIRQENHE